MSLLNSVVEKLLENKNRVIFDPHQKRAVMSIDAVVLASYRGQAFQLLFSKEFDAPLVWDGEVHYNPEARGEELIPVVYICDEFQGLMAGGYGRGGCGWKDVNELFTLLLVRVRGGLEILEFAATRPTYPILFDDCLEVFDNRPGFEDSNGLFHHSRMLIQLRPDNNGLESLRFPGRHHDSRSGEKVTSGKLETGNILMWSELNNSIHWVTRGVDGIVRSLGSAGDAKDYDAFLQWGRRFSVKGWTVGDLIPMPYSLPKAEPMKETHPGDLDQALPALKGLMGRQSGTLEIPLMNALMAAVDKHLPGDSQRGMHRAMENILNTNPCELDVATLSMLGAAHKIHLPPEDRSAEYEQLAGDVILEYSAGKSGPVIKALNEVKLLIQAAFVKKSNSEQK